MNVANSLLHVLDVKNEHALPNFDRATQLIMGSDYSGQQKGSYYEAYGFVLTDLSQLEPWMDQRSRLRREFLTDSRRLSYKTASERHRSRMLPAFLAATDSISGLVVVILVKKSILSLFTDTGRINTLDLTEVGLEGWKHSVIERLLRVCHFASLIVSGLSKGGQNLLWITDEDDIVANIARHRKMVNIFATISSHYLQHTLGRLQIGTNHSDPGTREIEDFVSISDLAAGAVNEVMNAYQRDQIFPIEQVILGVPESVTPKARTIMNWFSTEGQPLRRLVFAFEDEPGSTKISVKHYHFHSLPGFVK